MVFLLYRGVFRGHLTTEIKFQSSPEFYHTPIKLFLLDEIGQNSWAHILKIVEIKPKNPPPQPPPTLPYKVHTFLKMWIWG